LGVGGGFATTNPQPQPKKRDCLSFRSANSGEESNFK